MKQKMKVLFVFAAIICLSFIFAAAANADTVITADVLPVTYDSLKVDIHCGASYMTSTQFYVQYDPQTLDFVSADTLSEKQGDFGTAKLVEDGKLFVSFYAAKHAFNNEMLTLRFDLKNHHTAADAGFTTSFENLYVSKDNSGADSAVADDGMFIWNIQKMEKLALTVGGDTVYDLNECKKPDYSALTVYGIWPNNVKIQIPLELCTINDTEFNGSKTGMYNIYVTYAGYKASFKVSVGVPEPVKIVIASAPVKREYTLNSDETLDTTGLKVEAHYEDNYVESVPVEDLILEGFNVKASAGKQTITVRYFNCSATFDITIKDPNATPQYKLGDINEDGNVTTADARLALRNAVGLEKLTDVQILAADINKDGKVETSDARLILRAAVGLEQFS